MTLRLEISEEIPTISTSPLLLSFSLNPIFSKKRGGR